MTKGKGPLTGPLTGLWLECPWPAIIEGGMQYQAYLSRTELEPGAALVITGNRLATQDTVTIALAGKKKAIAAVVSAFGLGRLVLAVNTHKVELQPWLSSHDEPPETPMGPVSKWTVRSVTSS